MPIGAHATVDEGTLHLRAIVINPEGTRMVKRESYGLDATQVGTALGEELLAGGAREILG
jgi:hydroxymethylbilane synthase